MCRAKLVMVRYLGKTLHQLNIGHLKFKCKKQSSRGYGAYLKYIWQTRCMTEPAQHSLSHPKTCARLICPGLQSSCLLWWGDPLPGRGMDQTYRALRRRKTQSKSACSFVRTISLSSDMQVRPFLAKINKNQRIEMWSLLGTWYNCNNIRALHLGCTGTAASRMRKTLVGHRTHFPPTPRANMQCTYIILL